MWEGYALRWLRDAQSIIAIAMNPPDKLGQVKAASVPVLAATVIGHVLTALVQPRQPGQVANILYMQMLFVDINTLHTIDFCSYFMHLICVLFW